MTTLVPQSNFQLFLPNHAAQMQAHREDDWLTVSMAYALAEMANRGATTEQLNGARNFIHILQNLGEKTPPAKKLPVSRLETWETDDVAALAKQKAETEAAKQKET